jgi:hypothetical protein
MSHAETDATEDTCVFPWSAIGAPLAKDAVLHAPLFTRPVVGDQAIQRFYLASCAIAGSLKIRWSLSQGNENLVVGDQLVEERDVFSGFWLRRDASGAVIEISHGMRPFAHLPPYHDAMQRQLAGLVSDAHWELDAAARVTAPLGKETFPPMKFEEDARFFSPLLGKPLQGAENVRHALAEATSIYGTRRFLAAFSGRNVLGNVWEAAVDGHVVRCVAVVVISPAGAVKDVVGCMLPYPALELIYHKMKERTGGRLGPEYYRV